MSNIRFIQGNIFGSRCQTLVNTVNCVGVMGAGLAFECRLRYPHMYGRYAQLCTSGELRVGRLWLYKDAERWVLNFPTKQHWKDSSTLDYLRMGLDKFVASYRERGIASVAFPLLGTQHGGLDPAAVRALMEQYLSRCTIPVEIYRHDPAAADDCYAAFRALVRSTPDAAIKEVTGLRADRLRYIRAALEDSRICQLNQLLQVPGIGEKTLEKCFGLMRGRTVPAQVEAQAQLQWCV